MALLSGLTAPSDCTVSSRDFCPSSSQRPFSTVPYVLRGLLCRPCQPPYLRAKSSLELGRLLPYDGPLVRLVIQEQNELEMKIRALEDDGVTTATHARWPTLIILVRVVHQNKRCLLAYHSQRLSAIRTAYWAAGGAAPHVIAQLRDDMSQDEIVYLRSYHESVVEYRQTLSPADVLDIAMGIEDPPRESPFITVEVVLPLGGPVHTESGLLDFRVGHRYVLQKRDVEHLILQGYLREVLV
ncbi:GINS complex Psf1 component [Mycena olivaceomarginata]|nr:GINS complex Psf1 component [Mycena olivaceomarginata]